MAMFFVVVVGIGWFISFYYDNLVILLIAIIFSVGMNMFSYYNSDKIVLKMYKAHEITRDSHRELWNSVENLSITAGLPMPKVFIIQDPAPNAFATGRDKEHAVIAVTSGLLEIMDKNELDGVIAHELSHIGNRDILLMTMVVILVGFISIIADIFLRGGLGGGDRDSKGGVLFIVGIVFIILSPIVGKIIQLTVSRKREFLADSSAALLTRYPEGLASALEKLGSYGGKMAKANKATAHMFISSPFGSKSKKGFLSKMFMTHPPIEERIMALRGMN